MSSGTNDKFQTESGKGEKESEEMKLQNVCIQKSMFHIDKKMWRFKLHYFMLYGGLSFAMPFIPIYASNRIGLSNTALAVILMVQQFSFVFTKPFIGYFADYFKKFKVIMCILISIQTVCFCLILAIPPIDLNISYAYLPCLTNMNNGSNSTNCLQMLSIVNVTSSQNLNSSVNCAFIEGHEYQNCFSISVTNTSTVSFGNLNERGKDFLTYQFWLFALAYSLGMICIAGLFTLSDTACCESVKKFKAEYGRQRLWGGASWGLLAPLAGYINDYSEDYKISFIIMGIFSTLTMLNITQMDLVKPQFSSNILRNFWTVLKSGEFLVFEVGLICNGIGAGMIWYFLILFLNSIGSSKFLCGFSLTVQCFLGSIPFMFFSENIISKLGHLNVLSLSLLVYAIRFMWYSYLYNPWFVLIVESLHGITFGLMYANIASFGKDRAKVGTEATTQSVLATTHEGLGAGLGCVLGGLGFDHFGGHSTFFAAGLFAMFSLVLHQILVLSVNKNKKALKEILEL